MATVEVRETFAAIEGCLAETERGALFDRLVHGGGWIHACRSAYEQRDACAVNTWITRWAADAGSCAISRFARYCRDRSELVASHMLALLIVSAAAIDSLPGIEAAASARNAHRSVQPLADYPLAYYYDLYNLLHGEVCTPPLRTLSVAVALIDALGTGLIAALVLEEVPSTDSLSLYPRCQFGFLALDDECQDAMRNAVIYVCTSVPPSASAVRWSLQTHRTGKELNGLPTLKSSCLGAALAYGMEQLLGHQSTDSNVDLRDYLVCAGTDKAGRLQEIASLEKKLMAAEQATPKLRLVVLAQGSAAHPSSHLRVKRAATICDVGAHILSDQALLIRQRRRHVAKRIAAAVVVVLTAIAVLSAGYWVADRDHRYRYVVSGTSGQGETITIEVGYPGPSREIDTGLLNTGMQPEQLRSLISAGWCRSRTPTHGTVRALLDHMQDVPGRCEAMLHLGPRRDSLALLRHTMTTDKDSNNQMMAGLLLARYSPKERQSVISFLTNLYFHPAVPLPPDNRPRLAALVGELQGVPSADLVRSMRTLIRTSTSQRHLLFAYHVLVRAKTSPEDPLRRSIDLKRLATRSTDLEVRMRAAQEMAILGTHPAAAALDATLAAPIDDLWASYYASQTLSVIAYHHRSLLRPSSVVLGRVADTIRKVQRTDPASRILTEAKADAIRRLISARTLPEFRSVVDQLSSFVIKERQWVGIVSLLAALKLSEIIDEQVHGDIRTGVHVLLAEIRSLASDRLAFYRIACARSIPLIVRPEDRSDVVRVLQQEYATERQDHIRMALGWAIEDLTLPPDHVYPLSW